MGELISGRTPEEIKSNLSYLVRCENCPQNHEYGCDYDQQTEECRTVIDALALIEHLEAQQPKWINAKERLPEDCKDVLVWAVYHEEYGRSWALREVDAYCKGVGWENTADPDVREVTHWMPLPQMPEEESNA